MTARPLYLALLALTSSLVACLDQESHDPTDEVAEAVTVGQACPVSGTDVTKSLAVTISPSGSLGSALALFQSKFTFTRTLDQILATSGAAPTETGKTLFQQWMSTFGTTDCSNPKIDPNHYGEVCPRTNEFELASVDPTDPASPVQYLPVAVTNRFDLAPKSGANCGEYRMVYAMKSTGPIAGRSTIIFEGAMPNPTPAAGAAGCLPIAEFWQGLSNETNPTTLVTQLEKFYFLGTAIKGVPAVVDAHHYGLAAGGAGHAAGQIRTNMFINFFQWHLREFKTTTTCGAGSGAACTLTIDHVTAKVNPANEVFQGTSTPTLNAAFLSAFPKQVNALAATDVSTIGMAIANEFNEFESVSQGQDVDYSRFTDAALTSALGSGAAAKGLTVFNVLDRATTQTCAGCHEISNGAALGGGLTWPQSLGFVQIDEQGNTSPALQQAFLPHRKAVLEAFINKQCGAGSGSGSGAVVDDGLTIGGQQVGAAN